MLDYLRGKFWGCCFLYKSINKHIYRAEQIEFLTGLKVNKVGSVYFRRPASHFAAPRVSWKWDACWPVWSGGAAGGRRSMAFGMQSEHTGGNMMTAAENGDALNLTDSSPSDSVTNQVLSCSYTFISPSSPSFRPPPSPVCRFLFFPLSLQLQSWQIAFTLLHFRIIARSCHPEKVTIPTALRFNSSVSSVTDSINGKNGPKDDAKKEKLQICRWMPFPSDPTVTPGEVLLFYAALLPSKKPCW